MTLDTPQVSGCVRPTSGWLWFVNFGLSALKPEGRGDARPSFRAKCRALVQWVQDSLPLLPGSFRRHHGPDRLPSGLMVNSMMVFLPSATAAMAKTLAMT